MHLAALPVPPRIGKMMLMGAILQCLDPVLTMAASLGFRDPFTIPLVRDGGRKGAATKDDGLAGGGAGLQAKQKEADAMRKVLANRTCSDHFALLNAFNGWKAARASGTDRAYCWDHFLSAATLEMIGTVCGCIIAGAPFFLLIMIMIMWPGCRQDEVAVRRHASPGGLCPDE